MECLGATPLERLCGYVINLLPLPLLYSTELWVRLRECCRVAVTPLSVSFSLSPPLSFSPYPLPCLCHSASFFADCLRKGTRARRWEEEMNRSIFLSGNRLPYSDSLSLSLCVRLSFVQPACLTTSSEHPGQFQKASQISNRTQRVRECATSSTHIHSEGAMTVTEIKEVGVMVEKDEGTGHLFLNVMTSLLWRHKLNFSSCITTPYAFLQETLIKCEWCLSTIFTPGFQ